MERQGNILKKHEQENTKKSEVGENVGDHQKTPGETMETKQEPEKARVSPLSSLRSFLCHLERARHSTEHTAHITQHRDQSVEDTEHSTQHRAEHTAQSLSLIHI